MATCKRVPLSPTAMEAAAMTAGPVRNLTAIEKAATRLPHAMILGCKAMNRPVIIMMHHHKGKGDKASMLSSPLVTPICLSCERNKHLSSFHYPHPKHKPACFFTR